MIHQTESEPPQPVAEAESLVGVASTDLFSEGDYVRYKEGKGILHCGSGTYERAVVASMKPFVLISEWGDMKWSATVEVSKFEKCGEAGRKELLAVMDRFKRELYPENAESIHPESKP
jgi:hypothetical protein